MKLTKKLRKKLKKPFGKPILNFDSLSEYEAIICVGDATCERILNAGISPKICIYDGKNMRQKVGISEAIKNFDAKEFCVKNPPGQLTEKMFEVIAKGLKSKSNIKIYVKGEEDLAALAAVNLSPAGSLVLYGQPNENMIGIEVDEETKRKVKRILDEME